MTINPAAPNRRALLNALVALPILGTTAGPASALQATKPGDSASAGLAAAIFSNRRSAAILGQAYLLQRPDEADVARLEALLLSPANLDALSQSGIVSEKMSDVRPEMLKRGFQGLRRRDFEEGQVLQIDGCMLSVTELRLCALAALT